VARPSGSFAAWIRMRRRNPCFLEFGNNMGLQLSVFAQIAHESARCQEVGYDGLLDRAARKGRRTSLL
jgi:hypothetical protein